MPTVYDTAQSFRAALLAEDRTATLRLIAAYGDAWARLTLDLAAVTRLIAEKRSAGETPSASWLHRQARYQALLAQVAEEVNRITATMEPLITGQQASFVRQAQEHARELVRLSQTGAPSSIDVTFTTLNPDALTSLVGFLSDGSPLATLLNELGPDAAQRVSQALTRGMILGHGIPEIARETRKAFGGTMARALTIARTETLRAYRESSLLTYQANADVLRGWVWLSARDKRTDAFCWAMHGTVHPLSARMATHPRCRCTPVPFVKGEPSPVGRTGAELFPALPAA
ncbi:MAG TPA: minor capsid protein, partial [Chloroflexota bacterium]|nr:minor capsid protein [Chloroflexota bacterium]